MRKIGGCPPRGWLLASPAPPVADSVWMGGTRAMHLVAPSWVGALRRSGCHVGPRFTGTPPARKPPGRRSGGSRPVAAPCSQGGLPPPGPIPRGRFFGALTYVLRWDQVPLNYPSETVVQPSPTAHFHYGFPTVEPLSWYSNKLLSSNLKTAISQPCKRCHTP